VTCAEFLKELTDYLDDALDQPTRAELEEHLVWCHECFVVCDTTKKTIQIYRESKIYELPDPLRNRLHNAIMSKCREKKAGAPAPDEKTKQ
jgi:anti-sigma factor RsiW